MERKSTAKAQLLGITLFGVFFAWVGIATHGLLLAYLNVSGYLALFICGFATYQVASRFDAYLQKRYLQKRSSGLSMRADKLRLLKPVLVISTFLVLFYILFFVQPDKLVIAHFKEIPIEALYPCSNRPLEPEVEKIAREIFRLREIDRFDDRFCSSTE